MTNNNDNDSFDPSDEHAPASQPNTIRPGGGRKWIHAASVTGKWQRLRVVVASVLLLLFYASPWITIDHRPFLRLTFLESSFYLLGQTILIYEFHHFVLLALLLVLVLFLASAAAGRVWCGWACPQTIFVEHILLRIEALVEGPATRRLAKDGKPLSPADIARKVLKHLLFLVICVSFSFTLVAIFTGPQLLIEGHTGAWIATGILTALAWFDGGWWREQFCHIVCPYARFQSVMQDTATRTIGYDPFRGEPRGRGKNRSSKGSCIDCGLCVRVCPSGIDIRQGASQLECTGCARCIDACDSVMENTGQALGLIRYDALAIFQSRGIEKPKIMRARVLIYVVACAALTIAGIWLFVTRASFHVKQIAAGKAAPYILQGDNLSNLFNLKIANQARGTEAYTISLVEPESLIKIMSPSQTQPVQPGQEITFPVLLTGKKTSAGMDVHVVIEGIESKSKRTVKRVFSGPGMATK